MRFFVYLLECSDHSYYCGYTKDLVARVKVHNTGKGARYTRSRRPVRLVYSESYSTLSRALKREAEIKSFSRKKKQFLIMNGQKC
ncbi:GIY-YIG nuclease family protein [archaeon]|nr:GIY-YIG nuclease family protein [archaeon]